MTTILIENYYSLNIGSNLSKKAFSFLDGALRHRLAKQDFEGRVNAQIVSARFGSEDSVPKAADVLRRLRSFAACASVSL